jgi:cytochrome c2
VLCYVPRGRVALALPLSLSLAFAFALCLSPAAARAQSEGRRAIQRYGCANCHAVEGVQASAGASCVGCHQRVLAAPRSGVGRAPTVRHYLHAPDLRRVTHRLREDYLVRFLQDPHDVRPRLEETMPRLPVTEADARLIAQFLRTSAGPASVPSAPAPSPTNVERGRQVFRDAGCAVCHELGNLDLGVRIPPEALAGMGRPAYEAPNLRFARDRLDPDVALAWILDPRSLDPGTQMPNPQLSRADAVAVRDFILLADPGRPASQAPPPSAGSLAPVTRRVRFAEVRRIFQRSCIHCHAHTSGHETASAFGFAPGQLDLSTLEGVRAGTRLPDGSHRSVLAPDASGTAPLLLRLLRRHAEAVRDVTAPRRDSLAPVRRERPRGDEPAAEVGMPIGLPPVSTEDLRLIATWIAQGAND